MIFERPELFQREIFFSILELGSKIRRLYQCLTICTNIIKYLQSLRLTTQKKKLIMEQPNNKAEVIHDEYLFGSTESTIWVELYNLLQI